MSLFLKSNCEPAEHVMKYALIHLGMRKCPDEKIEKMMKNEDNA
jgi:hypothetical protein